MKKAREHGDSVPARKREQLRVRRGTFNSNSVSSGHLENLEHKIIRERNGCWQVLKIAKAVSARLS